jgi:hypothetical protein
MKATHHKCLEIGPPPLCKTISNFPLVVDAMRRVELLGLYWRREALIEAPFQSINVVLTRFEIVTGPVHIISLLGVKRRRVGR